MKEATVKDVCLCNEHNSSYFLLPILFSLPNNERYLIFLCNATHVIGTWDNFVFTNVGLNLRSMMVKRELDIDKYMRVNVLIIKKFITNYTLLKRILA